jgi:hypothetical protein
MHPSLLLGILAALVAVPAGATVMDAWTRYSVQFTNLGRAGAADTAIGVQTITTTGGGTHLQTMIQGSVPGLSLSTTIPVTDPVVSNGGIVEVILTSVRARPDLTGQEGFGATLGNISGALASTAGGLAPRTVPNDGTVRICLVLTGCGGFFLPLDVGGTSIGGKAIGIGVGGILTIGGTNTIMISVIGAPYTVKTITAFNRTADLGLDTYQENGFAHGPASATSSTGQTSGVIQVVTANHITTSGVPGNSDISGVFTRTLVHYVPEPGMMLLLGAGSVGMALLGTRRARK